MICLEKFKYLQTSQTRFFLTGFSLSLVKVVLTLSYQYITSTSKLMGATKIPIAVSALNIILFLLFCANTFFPNFNISFCVNTLVRKFVSVTLQQCLFSNLQGSFRCYFLFFSDLLKVKKNSFLIKFGHQYK